MDIFIYGDAETSYLKKRDKTLGAAIETIGPIRRAVIPDLFSALVNAIVGQQISSKAQATVWQRMTDKLGDIASQKRLTQLPRTVREQGTLVITPRDILACPEAELQSCGITFKKASYIRSAAEKAATGGLDIDALRSKSDAEVCAELVKLDGIGAWTAEMLMLFSMQRPDILSYGDLAILRGMRMLYRYREITRDLFEKHRRRYSPYGSVASLYLWAIAGGAVPELKDRAVKQRG